MIDQKPPRYEDYQAAQERAARAEADLAQFRQTIQKGRNVRLWQAAQKGAIIGFAVLCFFVLGRPGWQFCSWLGKPGKPDCYFVARNAGEPWQMKWHVWKLPRPWSGDGEHIAQDSPTFETQLDAWNWARSYNLNMCR